MGLFDVLMGQLANSDTIDSISEKTNADSDKMGNLMSMALPLLMQGMQKNAGSSSGASALARALDDHADDPDDVSQMLANVNTSDGSKILQHILGGNTQKVEAGLAKKSGLSSNQVGSALSMIAPALLSLLGTQKRQNNLDAGGISGLMSALTGGSSSGRGSMAGDLISLVMRDSDGDGKSDILELVKGFFGKN